MTRRNDSSNRWRARRSRPKIATMPEYHFIGRGLYSLSDAERLTRIPKARIRRWLEGYTYRYRGERKRSRPIISSDFSRDVGELALSFADLMEVRFLEVFREHGVSWREIRAAADRVGELVNSTHPFSNRRFKTDGRRILAEIERDDDLQLLQIVRQQWEIHKLVAPVLLAGVEFDGNFDPAVWRPEKDLRVVIDPQRAFGAPIAIDGSVQTRVLAAAAKAERSQKIAAWMYRVPLRAIRDAVQFEKRYAA